MQHPQLPEAELAVMQTVWDRETPISSVRMAELMKPVRGWKKQTVYTLLSRLVEKGFLSSEKQGKERIYTPLMSQEEYLNRETGQFVRRFHKNSLTGLMNALYAEKSPKEEDLEALESWLRERK